MSARPFGQPPIAAKDARLEPFEGRAFRFYLLLPRYRQEQEVFSAMDALDLAQIFTLDFGGCTRNDVERSPVIGTWELREPGAEGIAIDLHVEFFVYTKPTQRCLNYFTQLELNLREHLWQVKGIREEQILIERIDVEIIRGTVKPRRRKAG
jgi:hypothetical protein